MHQEWLQYMKEKHIPDVLSTGCFCGYTLFRIITTQEEGELSYSIQYFCNSMAELNQYQREHARQLQSEHAQKYGKHVLAFRTILETV